MKQAHTSARLEAFSDGVIAVIITIMVLELHVPHLDGIAGFKSVLPRLAIYLLSFLMTAIYWINHHELCARVHTVDYRILWSNLAWLFSLSLVPYFTDYISEKHFDAFSTALYGLVLLFVGLVFWVLRIAIMSNQRAESALDLRDKVEAKKHVASMALYIGAIPVAYWHPVASLALNFAVTLLWILPELGIRHLEQVEHPSPHPPSR